MTTITEERPVFENEEWLVTAGGLEHKGTGYFIARESVGRRRSDGLWSWPLHMAEKQWCTLAPFTEAFTCAAALYGNGADTDLAHSFKAARCEVAAWPRPRRAAHQPVATLAESLNGEGRIPILIEVSDRDDGRRGHGAQPLSRMGQSSRDRSRGRSRPGSASPVIGLSWRTPRPIRRAGTRLVQLLQAALSRR